MHEQYTFEILLISLLQSQCVCPYARVLHLYVVDKRSIYSLQWVCFRLGQRLSEKITSPTKTRNI